MNSVSTARFQAVKRFLASNSYRDGEGQYWIYPSLLLETIREVKAMRDIKLSFQSPRLTRKLSSKEAERGRDKLAGSRVIKFRGSGVKIEVNRREEEWRSGVADEMRYLSLSKFVEIENEFLKGKEDRIELILDLLKKKRNF